MTLPEYLKKNGETIDAFAKRAGLPTATVWRIVRGIGTPRPSNAMAVEKAAGGEVPATLLLGLSE